MFVSYLSLMGLRQSSITTYLSALRHLQIEAGQTPTPRDEWPRLHYTLRGIKRAQSSTAKMTRLPITREVMSRIQTTLFSPGYPLDYEEKVMLWAACNVGYFGFLRSGEFTVKNLSAEPAIFGSDVAVDSHSNPSRVRIRLRRSKTDAFGNGVYIYLGRTIMELCPVVAMLSYMAIRPKIVGPLFFRKGGQPLTKDSFLWDIRAVLEAAMLNPKEFAGHSFRIGVATSAAIAGVPDHLIKVLGRWESDAYQLYIRTPADTLTAVSQIIAGPAV